MTLTPLEIRTKLYATLKGARFARSHGEEALWLETGILEAISALDALVCPEGDRKLPMKPIVPGAGRKKGAATVAKPKPPRIAPEAI